MASETLLETRRLTKFFGRTAAIKDVSISFLRGELHAIVGENGAGKSTLIKVLTGALQPSAGEILWEGEPAVFSSPRDAHKLGFSAVHQEVILCRHLTVAQNIFLGEEARRWSVVVDDAAINTRAAAIIDHLGFPLEPTSLVSDLTIGQQQLVVAAKAEAVGVKFLIFDEPTAYLSRAETESLFRYIQELRSRGVTILYISHRMEEVFELADRVSVFRDGRLISTRAVSETDEQKLIADMAGREITQLHYKASFPKGETLLEAEALCGPGFSDVSLFIRQGEIVGMYGLIGSGRSEFALTVFGRLRISSGSIKVRGRSVSIASESDAIGHRIAMVPESRREQGLCPSLSVEFNLNLATIPTLTRFGYVDQSRERDQAEHLVSNLRVNAPSLDSAASTLSGGNQQKLIIGRWLETHASIFIFDEPTAGIDVGTKNEIYKLFAELLQGGAGILLISSYLPEVYDLADRLYVMKRGRLAGCHEHGTISQEAIVAEAVRS
jgi:ribose transport system ATP-binding protein